MAGNYSVSSVFPLLAIIAGSTIALQAGINSQLGRILESSILAVMISFSVSALFALVVFLLVYTFGQNQDGNSVALLRSTPWHLLILGGVLNASAILLFYYLIPKIGIGQMMSYALSGQILIAMVVGHFAWFQVPFKPINVSQGVGLVALIVGIILINR